MSEYNTTPPAVEPQVGQGATVLYWSDRHAGTIIEVSKNKKRVVVQRDKAKRVDANGMSDAQTYEFTPDPEGQTWVFSLRKNGRWAQVGETMSGGLRLGIGYRSEYYDYTF